MMKEIGKYFRIGGLVFSLRVCYMFWRVLWVVIEKGFYGGMLL